ncbi:MAG: CarD family transcriptional regulator, partial [Hyphomicrobiales bacterium]|nr:CarD family transcriptional regulator [Hyphomicrobiales bacterium]
MATSKKTAKSKASKAKAKSKASAKTPARTKVAAKAVAKSAAKGASKTQSKVSAKSTVKAKSAAKTVVRARAATAKAAKSSKSPAKPVSTVPARAAAKVTAAGPAKAGKAAEIKVKATAKMAEVKTVDATATIAAPKVATAKTASTKPASSKASSAKVSSAKSAAASKLAFATLPDGPKPVLATGSSGGGEAVVHAPLPRQPSPAFSSSHAHAHAPADQSKAAARPASQRQGFKTGEHVVYPSHGVGQIVSIEEQEVAGYKLELFVVGFARDKMILRVPTAKAGSVGMRKLSSPEHVERALGTLTGRARVKRTMWSRRAQEYDAKINSGDLIAIAEVVRDLYRSEAQPEQSYSERQLYEAALDRMSREVAAVRKLVDEDSLKLIEAQLLKGP